MWLFHKLWMRVVLWMMCQRPVTKSDTCVSLEPQWGNRNLQMAQMAFDTVLKHLHRPECVCAQMHREAVLLQTQIICARCEKCPFMSLLPGAVEKPEFRSDCRFLLCTLQQLALNFEPGFRRSYLTISFPFTGQQPPALLLFGTVVRGECKEVIKHM